MRSKLLMSGSVLGLVVVSWVVPADARPEYPTWVPTRYGCETCHLDPRDRLARNGFGIDFALQRGVWSNLMAPGEGLCFLDSDGDGLTNGVELADPDCVWQRGDELPMGPISHPGEIRDPDRCNNGQIDPGEACDDDDLGGETCQTAGFFDGEIGCFDDCTLDTRDCVEAPEPDMAPPMPDMAPPMPDMAPPTPDMGPPTPDMDAVDAGPFDAGPADAGEGDMAPVETDAMLDMSPDGMDAIDAMPVPDGEVYLDMVPYAMEPSPDDGCRAAPGHSTGGGAFALVLVALGLGARRRRST